MSARPETYRWCTVHGAGPCVLLDGLTARYRSIRRKEPHVQGLILAALERYRPEHAAVYTRHAEPRVARRCLQSTLRSARARARRDAIESGA